MKLEDGTEVSLTARHFLVNIAMPDKTPEGLTVVNRDPRKQRIKPGCYVGTVEEASNDCQLVKPGDRVVFERWEWTQFNVDSERLIAHEKELMIINETPAPNVIVLEIIQHNRPTTSLYVPETYRPQKLPYHHGKIVASGASAEFGLVGDDLYVESYETGQFVDGKGRLFFKLGKGALVLMKLERMALALEAAEIVSGGNSINGQY